MEYWIVYDLVSGIERYRGAGSEGSAAIQALPDGAGIVLVPPGAVRGADVDLEVIRAAMVAQVDAQAELARQSFLTPGAGQALTNQRKEAEARAWILDQSAAVPFLSAEASARGMPIVDLAAEVVRNADAWIQAGAAIEAKRMGAKVAAASATTLGAIVAASKIDWTMFA